MAESSNAFKLFEQAGWSDPGLAAKYDRWFPDITSQSVMPLLDALSVGAGTALLDVATGPGLLAGSAAARGARVIGIDFSPAMVEIARRNFAGVEYRAGDAEGLDFPDASFDVVAINYGLLHLADPDRALAEAYRVLRRAGRLGFTVWDVPRATGFGFVLDAVAAHGVSDVGLPPGPPFFRFADAEESRRRLLATGFVEARVRRLDQVWQLPSAAALLASVFGGWCAGRGVTSRTDAGGVRGHPFGLRGGAAAVSPEQRRLCRPDAGGDVRGDEAVEPTGSRRGAPDPSRR